jgi:Protein of unknown function (DUF541)
MKHLFLLIPALACAATAQTFDGINAPVSRTVTLTADEAAFTITAAGTLDSTQPQVKQALQSAGLPNPTVVAIGLGQDNSIYPPGAAQILYSATVAIPAGTAMDAAKALETLRSHLPAPLTSLQYSVAFNPSQAALDAARQVALPRLLDDARKSAQTLAAAAGVKVGAIRYINDSAGVYAYVGNIGAPAGQRSGDFSSLGTFLLGVPSVSLPSSTQYTFSLNVVFATAP